MTKVPRELNKRKIRTTLVGMPEPKQPDQAKQSPQQRRTDRPAILPPPNATPFNEPSSDEITPMTPSELTETIRELLDMAEKLDGDPLVPHYRDPLEAPAIPPTLFQGNLYARKWDQTDSSLTFKVLEGVYGNYEIQSEYSSDGGTSSILLAKGLTGPHAGKMCVLKRMDIDLSRQIPQAVLPRRNAREIALLRLAMGHQNIVQLLDYDASEGYMILEFIEGERLDDFIVNGQGKDPNTAVGILRQITKALHDIDCATGENEGADQFIHRDLKPENIILVKGQDGTLIAKLLDFGIALAPVMLTEKPSRVPNLPGDGRFTANLFCMGTPVWGAPEQVMGSGAASVDQRADIFSLGLLLYALLTGEIEPYNSNTLCFQKDALLAELREKKPAHVSDELWTIVTNCIRFDREDRTYNNYIELLTALLVAA